MGSELVKHEPAPRSHTESFYEAFPFYLSIGMTYEQYWNGDCELPKYYRESYRLRKEDENYNAWLQGAYVYDALCAVSPVLRAFAKGNTKPIPYHKHPYGVDTNGEEAGERVVKREKTEEELRAIRATNASAKFSVYAAQFNKQFENRGGEKVE